MCGMWEVELTSTVDVVNSVGELQRAMAEPGRGASGRLESDRGLRARLALLDAVAVAVPWTVAAFLARHDHRGGAGVLSSRWLYTVASIVAVSLGLLAIHEALRCCSAKRSIGRAAGRSNRQIAQALFISRSTASVHVSHILAKLGASSRVEATAFAYRLGIVDHVAPA